MFRRCHMVCMPTRYGEGVPRVLIEAAASGRAIVTTDVSGCREIVRDGVNGLLVPPGNVEALAAALRRLLTDRDERRRLAAAGREVAAAGFAVEQVIAETMSVYSRLLGQEMAPRQNGNAVGAGLSGHRGTAAALAAGASGWSDSSSRS